MADTLTQLIAKLQAVLLDDGTIFSTATCTATIRHALSQLNLRVPIHGGTLIDTVDGQYEYELTSALAGAAPLTITGVWLQDPAGNTYDTPLVFQAYSEDERFFFRLAEPQAADEHLIVRFTQNNTIYGLDSATESTLTAEADVVLLDGAAAQACRTASVGKVLTNNLDPNAPANYLKAADAFSKAFENGLSPSPAADDFKFLCLRPPPGMTLGTAGQVPCTETAPRPKHVVARGGRGDPCGRPPRSNLAPSKDK